MLIETQQNRPLDMRILPTISLVNVKITNWTGTTDFTLDLLGRITSVNDSNNKAVSYGYDTAGNKTSIVYPDNSVVQYGYDDLNRLVSVTDPENAVQATPMMLQAV